MSRPKKQLSPTAEEGRNARDDILSAALRAFARDGFEGASMPKIAKMADVAPPLIHYYFGSKDRLWRETVDHSLGQLRKEAATISSATRSLKPLDRLRALIHAFAQFAAAWPDQFVMVIAEARSDSDRFAWIQENYTNTLLSDVVSILEDAKAQGAIKDVPSDQLTFMIMGSVLLYFTVYPGIPRDRPLDQVAEDYADLLFDILMQGISA